MAKKASEIGQIEVVRSPTPGQGFALNERGRLDYHLIKDGAATGDLLQYTVDATSGEGRWDPLTFPAAPSTGDTLQFDGTDWTAVNGDEYIAVGQATVSATISATTAAGAATVIGLGAQTVRAAEIEFTFSCDRVNVPQASGGNALWFQLWEDSNRKGYMGIVNTNLDTAGGNTTAWDYPVFLRTLYTPAAGSKTFAIKAHRANANCTVYAGAADTADTEGKMLFTAKYTGR